MRRSLASLVALSITLAACGPKGGGTGGGGGTLGNGGNVKASASPTPLGWISDARTLATVGLGAGRFSWVDPAIRPGERLRWRVSGIAPSDLVIEVSRREPLADGSEQWRVQGMGGRELEAQLSAASSAPGRLTWKEKGGAPVVVQRSEDVAAIFPARVVSDEPAFQTAGGAFVGNEVVRVAAGEFRARHGVLARDGSVYHVYVVRSVPGGMVKMEIFREGADSPYVTYELEDFTRLKKEPNPLPTPMATAPPAP